MSLLSTLSQKLVAVVAKQCECWLSDLYYLLKSGGFPWDSSSSPRIACFPKWCWCWCDVNTHTSLHFSLYFVKCSKICQKATDILLKMFLVTLDNMGFWSVFGTSSSSVGDNNICCGGRKYHNIDTHSRVLRTRTLFKILISLIDFLIDSASWRKISTVDSRKKTTFHFVEAIYEARYILFLLIPLH